MFMIVQLSVFEIPDMSNENGKISAVVLISSMCKYFGE